MMGTATASLLGFSMAACPPRLKMPTRGPGRPRLRVGIALAVAELNGGSIGPAGDAAAVSGIRLPARAPAVRAPVVLRKLRREAVASCSLSRWSLIAVPSWRHPSSPSRRLQSLRYANDYVVPPWGIA